MEADVGHTDGAPCEDARNSGEVLELVMISYVSYHLLSKPTQAKTLLAPEETLRYVSREMDAVMPTQ